MWDRFPSEMRRVVGAVPEAQIAVRELVRRFPKMRMVKDNVKWMKGLTFRRIKSLPLILR
jgi:cytochrome P450